MKKISIIFSFLLLTSFLSFGQDSPTYRETLRKMMEVSGSEATYKAAISQMVTMFKQQKSSVPNEFWNEFEQAATKNVSEDLLNMLLPVYQRHLAETEIKDIIRFYQSPAGKKFAEKSPLIMQESMQIGQQWGMKIGQELEKKLKEKGY